MIGERVIRPAGFGEQAMRSPAVTFDRPAIAQERRKHFRRFGGWPLRDWFLHVVPANPWITSPLPIQLAKEERRSIELRTCKTSLLYFPFEHVSRDLSCERVLCTIANRRPAQADSISGIPAIRLFRSMLLDLALLFKPADDLVNHGHLVVVPLNQTVGFERIPQLCGRKKLGLVRFENGPDTIRDAGGVVQRIQ